MYPQKYFTLNFLSMKYLLKNFQTKVFASCLTPYRIMGAGDGRACKVDGRAQAVVGLGLATPLQPYMCSLEKQASWQTYCKHT